MNWRCRRGLPLEPEVLSEIINWATTPEPVEEGIHYTMDYPTQTPQKVRFNNNVLDDIKQVIFNEPATIVTFSDGTKVCVKACEKDTFNKETGLLFAIIKRLYANDVEKKTGYLKSTGLGEKISKIINNATDQKEVERERRKKHKLAKKAAEEAAQAKKAEEPSANEANNN